MGLFDSFPLSNAYSVNLDWIMKKIREIEEFVKNYAAVNKVEYAGVWDITKQYPKWALVADGDTSWLSLQPVPKGVPLENAEYWQKLADLDPRIAGIVQDVAKIQTVMLYNTNIDSLGVVKNSPNSAAENTKIVNEFFKNHGGVLYVPNGTYYFNSLINMYHGCGLIGECPESAHLRFTSGGIVANIDFDITDASNVAKFFAVQNITISSENGNNSSGLYLKNAFFENDCNSNAATYAELKGDAYALELRSSVFTNIKISGFRNGLEIGNFVAVANLNGIFIDTCSNCGAEIRGSDCNFSNIFITCCVNGLRDVAESNKYCNIKIYQNGHKNGAVVVDSYGALFEESKHCQITNFEAQENWDRGVVFYKCTNFIVDNLVADSNGFKSVNGVGINIMNSKNMFIRAKALNKNANKTQKYGILFDKNMEELTLYYSESEQQNAIRDNLPLYSRLMETADNVTTVENNAYTPLVCTYNNKFAKFYGAATIKAGWRVTLPFISGKSDIFFNATALDSKTPYLFKLNDAILEIVGGPVDDTVITFGATVPLPIVD